ncbi:hypothetical protein D3C80_1780790 [compost metagenome]
MEDAGIFAHGKNGLSVLQCLTTFKRGKLLGKRRCNKNTHHRPSFMHHRDADAPGIPAADEGAGSVDGIDNEDGGAGKPPGIVIRLFRKPAIVRPGGAQDGFENFVGGIVSRADR